MRTKHYTTVVVMPNGSHFEATYYCGNNTPGQDEANKHTKLFIQLSDCICTVIIEKEICQQPDKLEKLVHNKIINTKGHLC